MSHERSPISFLSLDELDLDALGAYVRRRLPRVEDADEDDDALPAAAARLGLVARTGHSWVPTATGLLLFGREPQLLHPQWGLVAARFDGYSVGDDVVAKHDCTGRLSVLLDDAATFVHEHTRTMDGQIADGPTQVEYAHLTVRELVANALVHRDLRATGRVAVRVFDDRLEVWSPGGATHQSVTSEHLPKAGGVSLPRNPLLAAHARELGLGEQLGRGLAAARRATARIAHQDLRLETDTHRWQVTVPSALAARPHHDA